MRSALGTAFYISFPSPPKNTDLDSLPFSIATFRWFGLCAECRSYTFFVWLGLVVFLRGRFSGGESILRGGSWWVGETALLNGTVRTVLQRNGLPLWGTPRKRVS